MNILLKNIVLISSLVLNVIAGKYFYETKSGPISQVQQLSKSETHFAEVKVITPSIVAVASEKTVLTPLVKKAKKKIRSISKLEKESVVVNDESNFIINHSSSYFETYAISETTQEVTTESIPTVQNTLINSEFPIVNDSNFDFSNGIQSIDNQFIDSNLTARQDSQNEVDASHALEVQQNESVMDKILESEKVSFKVILKDETNVKVVWADQNGKVMTVSNSTLDKGIQKLSLNTTEVSSGIYTIDIVDISNNNTLKSVRFVKL